MTEVKGTADMLDVKCKNCNTLMEKKGKIAFGMTWYYKYTCPTCNTNEHRAVQRDSLNV